MKQINKKFLSFFIPSSFCDRAVLTNRLSFAAKQAYFARNYEELEIYGNRLIDLSPGTETLGQYYLALAQSRYWSENREKVKRTFEDLAESEHSCIRAASLLALGGERLLNGKTDNETARLFLESCSIALRNKHLLTFVQSQSALSVLCSMNKDHPQSLEILKGLKPHIDRLNNNYLTADFYNSVAYELNQLGNSEAAKGFALYVMKSPHLSAYPEWQKNLREIFVKKEEKISIAFTEPLPPKPKGKLLQFKLKASLVPSLNTTSLFMLQGLKLTRFLNCTDDDLTAITALMQSRQQASQQSAEKI
jgi:hypothetical protein